MEELEKLLAGPVATFVKAVTATKKDPDLIDKYIREFKDLDRKIRPSQVGKIQTDKRVGKGTKAKDVVAIRSIAPYQRKIVTTAAAFEVGEPVTLTPVETTNLSDEVLRLWEDLRIDDKIQKAKVIQKSETECAFLFYMKKARDGEKETNEIKAKLLSNEFGSMSPFYDASGDMIAFTWLFNTKVDRKEIRNAWVFTDDLCYKISDQNGDMVVIEQLPHGFDKIPIVYIDQDFPEWHDVESLIDRYETALSKLGASNDYSGYPLLKLYGTVKSMPDRNEDGKTLNFPMKEVDAASGKTIHGDAEFLTNSNAPESVKLEMETLENLIFSLSSTPNLSFDNLKGSVGSISGIALKLLFLDSVIKSKMNEGDNRTMIQRIIKVLTSGIITTTNTKLSSQVKDTVIKIQFNSILPNDLKEAVEIVSSAVEAGVMSAETAVKFLDMTKDSEEELKLIAAENKERQTKKEKVTQ